MRKVFQFIFVIICCSVLAGPGFAQSAEALKQFDQGVTAMRARNFDDALAAFRRSQQLDPKFALAFHNAGLALVFLRRPAEATGEFRTAVRLAPTDAQLRLSLCKILFDTAIFGEAVTECRETLRLDNTQSEAHASLVFSLYRLRRTDEAFTALFDALRKFEQNEALLNTAGLMYMDAGKFDLAVPYFEALSRLKPDSAYYFYHLSKCYLRTERDSEAVAAANKVIQLDPKNSGAYTVLGSVYSEIGLNDEAVPVFQKALEINPRDDDALFHLAIAQTRLGKSNEAIASLRTTLKLIPDNFAYNYELGNALNHSGKFEEAVEPLRKAESLNPRDFLTKVSLGLALMESAQYEGALTVLTQADQMKPNNQVVTMYLSVTKARVENTGKIDYYKKRIADDPTLVNSRLNLANIYAYMRRPAEAEPLFLEAIKLQPNDGQLYNLLGIFYSDAGQQEKAAAAFQKATEFLKHSTLYISLAGQMEKLGRIQEAKNAYQKAYEIRPNSAGVLKFYGDFLRNTGDRQGAIKMYREALLIEPGNSPILFSLGILYIKTNNIELAKQTYEILKAVDPIEAKKFARCLKFKSWL